MRWPRRRRRPLEAVTIAARRVSVPHRDVPLEVRISLRDVADVELAYVDLPRKDVRDLARALDSVLRAR